MVETRLIDGKASAARLRARVAAAAAEFREATGMKPGLAAVLVGDDPASAVYVRNKGKAAEEAGLASFNYVLPASTSEATLLELIARLNADPAIHGILVQLPLPKPIEPERVIAAVDPAKDVDGFHPVNVGLLWRGLPALVPCTPWGCLILLRETLAELAGVEVLVVGRSAIVGKPMAALLLAANCTVTLAHSKSRDLPTLCARADIVVAAAGQAGLVRGTWLKPGATVIDVGIHRTVDESGKVRLVGDVAYPEAIDVAGWITPVPGGVGPMTVACLMRNTVIAASRQRGLAEPGL
jgi:methylenetetrahydrofolate dehydrogenase (NADP+)/methenyltetrahydrofolate cyclohydrolase